MMNEFALRVNEQAQVKGIVIIQDMKGMTASHAAQMKPAFAKKAVTVWQDASPQNPKAVHFLNMPGVVEIVFRDLSQYVTLTPIVKNNTNFKMPYFL